jgi:uncharacterized protein
MSERARQNYNRLVEHFSELDGVAVAFSGGVDSTLLAKASYDALAERAIAVTARSSTYPDEEYGQSVSLAGLIGIEHVPVDTNEMADPGFYSNPPDRCYHCKRELFNTIIRVAAERGIPNVAEGSTRDDESDYRPGMKAIEELGVRSPLRELGFTKSDVREMLRELGLPNWRKPAMACLASRIPYMSEITPEKLRAVGEAERFIRTLGIDHVRVRHHGSVARIEVSESQFATLLDKKLGTLIYDRLRELGFLYVALDLLGYRTGSMNEALSKEANDQ